MFGILIASLTIASPFADHAVVQAGRVVPVWGNAEAGARVTVTFAGQMREVSADDNGRWHVDLASLEPSSESRVLTVSDELTSLSVSDVLVGEVWLCAGQSNMELPLWGAPSVGQHAGRETDGYFDGMTVDEPEVRALSVGKDWSAEPLSVLRKTAAWQRFEPGKCRDLSAVAFHYALALRRSLKVPVGVIVTAWGGTPIQAWTPGLGGASPSRDVRPHRQAGVLWNAMVAPLAPYAVRGMIWYQGEDNRGDGLAYADRLENLYAGWSQAFGLDPLPFYMAEIAPFDYRLWETDDLMYRTEVREAQHAFARSKPNAGCASTVDIGDQESIHPDNKRTVALRLAANALNKTYGMKGLACEGPELESWKVAGDTVTLTFRNVRAWNRNGRDPMPFEVAGRTGPFCPAGAKLVSSNAIEVSSCFVDNPARLRYAWSWLQAGRLKNENGYPLAPFSADLSKGNDLAIHPLHNRSKQ